MTKTIRRFVWLAGVLAVSAPAAYAQAQAPAQVQQQGQAQQESGRVFVNASVGAQVTSRTFTASNSFALFGETATVTTPEKVGTGLVFDASAGVRVWRKLSISLGVTTFHESQNATGVAHVPSPIFFNHFTDVPTSVSNLSQTNVAVNLQAVWIQPITDKFDLAFGLGPSLIHVKQDIASADINATTLAATGKSTSESATTMKAGTVGFDFDYKFTPRWGAGLLVRYQLGEINLPSVANLKVGGLQTAVGVRIRY
jgi:hypothetical protein